MLLNHFLRTKLFEISRFVSIKTIKNMSKNDSIFTTFRHFYSGTPYFKPLCTLFESIKKENGCIDQTVLIWRRGRDTYASRLNCSTTEKRFPSRTFSLKNNHLRLFFFTLKALSGFESLNKKIRQHDNAHYLILAQREGFEPSCDCSQTDFESAPL